MDLGQKNLVSSVECHFIVACPPHFGYYVSIVERDYDEHGGRMGGHPWVQQGKPKEFSSTIMSTITKLTHQSCTTQSQGGQTKFRWWFHILFNGTRWRRQMLEVWWASQEKGLSQSTTSHKFQP
jgi:hypothetical protein